MSTLMLETITDTLAGGYKRLEKGTFQESSEVQNQRRTIEQDLRKRWVYTAHIFLARLAADSSVEFGLSGRPGFDAIAGEDIDKFTGEILDGRGNVYNLTPAQIQLIPTLTDIVWARAGSSDLGLVHGSLYPEWGYFPINTSDVRAEKLSRIQSLFAEKAHGSLTAKYVPEQNLTDYGENMQMLNGAGIEQTRFWLPHPNHIIQYIGPGKVVARASWLNSLGNSSDFGADNRNVSDHVALRGVKVVGEADAQKLAK